MLARQLLVAFLSVLIPSTVLLGAVTAYSVRSLGAVSDELTEIMRSREAVADLHLTVMRVGAPLGAFLLAGNVENRQRFEEMVRETEEKLRSCAATSCHSSTRTPARMVAALAPVIEQVKQDGQAVFEHGQGGARSAWKRCARPSSWCAAPWSPCWRRCGAAGTSWWSSPTPSAGECGP